jgi:hypothetical protein
MKWVTTSFSNKEDTTIISLCMIFSENGLIRKNKNEKSWTATKLPIS